MLVDEFTDHFFIKFLEKKSDVPALLQEFKAEAELHFGSKIGTFAVPPKLCSLRSDGESVNVSEIVRTWCKGWGIRHEVSAPYSQWQNGKAERAIKQCWEGSESMRKGASAPARFWPFSLTAFVHVRNMAALGEEERSPYERWYCVTIPLLRRIRHVRIWGCKAYALVPKELRRKLDDKAGCV